MDYTKYEINNYNLYTIKTNKFKTVSISMHFRKEDTKEDCEYRELLKKYLMAGTNKYRLLKDQNRARLNLYNPDIDFKTTLYGMDRSFILSASFTNEEYTEKGMNEKNILFILDNIYNPIMTNNTFDKEIFNTIKSDYLKELESLKDDSNRYVNTRLCELMNSTVYDSPSIKERIEIASSINEDKLYNYYKSLFTDNSLDIFVIGDIEIKDIIESKVKGNFIKKDQNRALELPYREIKEVTEEKYSTQSQMALGFRFNNLTDFERKYTLLVYTNILGGPWNSKLMQEVREKNSLCYSIYAFRSMSVSNVYVLSGIDKENFNKVYALTLKQVEEIKKGNITDKELAQVKQTYHNSLMLIEDNQNSILDNFSSVILNGTDVIEQRDINIDKVTKEDIVNLAKKGKLEVVYFLKGVNDEN